MDFLQKPSAWFPKFYIRVQSENCGRNSFLIFLFRFFSDFERKIFQTFSQKTSKSFQNYLLRVQRNSLWLEILQHGSQNSIYVSRVKISEETDFLFFFRIFSIFEQNFSHFWPKNSKKMWKLPFACPEEHFVNLIFSKKVLNHFGSSAETFGIVLKLLSSCTE